MLLSRAVNFYQFDLAGAQGTIFRRKSVSVDDRWTASFAVTNPIGNPVASEIGDGGLLFRRVID